ncbi:MAG: SGNH/GDSL hydrolase family protein [Pirellulales bacterium]|nr:SGNH/GDSL hydrolase family protein [Pirellulales bacterium]
MKRFALVLPSALVLMLLSIHAAASPQPAGEKAAASKPSSKQTRRAKPRPTPNDVFAPIVDNRALPRVLLIGDSISMGYTFPVRRMLAGKANVHRIPVNGHDTAEGLARLDDWLGDKPWDVIHFNFGLHDLKRLKNGQYDVRGNRVRSPEEYARNLEALAPRLKATGAALIWATTTPVPAGARGRAQGDEVLFNEAAAKVMKKHGVRVNDLCGHIRPDLAKAQRRRDVHFTAEGSEILARKVADEISAALKDRQKAGAADKL